jgi:hypothetical protein
MEGIDCPIVPPLAWLAVLPSAGVITSSLPVAVAKTQVRSLTWPTEATPSGVRTAS